MLLIHCFLIDSGCKSLQWSLSSRKICLKSAFFFKIVGAYATSLLAGPGGGGLGVCNPLLYEVVVSSHYVESFVNIFILPNRAIGRGTNDKAMALPVFGLPVRLLGL